MALLLYVGKCHTYCCNGMHMSTGRKMHVAICTFRVTNGEPFVVGGVLQGIEKAPQSTQ